MGKSNFKNAVCSTITHKTSTIFWYEEYEDPITHILLLGVFLQQEEQRLGVWGNKILLNNGSN